MEEVEYLEEYEDVVLTTQQTRGKLQPLQRINRVDPLQPYSSFYFEETVGEEEIVEDISPFQMHCDSDNDHGNQHSVSATGISEQEGNGNSLSQEESLSAKGANHKVHISTTEHSYNATNDAGRKSKNIKRRRRIRNVDAASSDDESTEKKRRPQKGKKSLQEKENEAKKKRMNENQHSPAKGDKKEKLMKEQKVKRTPTPKAKNTEKEMTLNVAVDVTRKRTSKIPSPPIERVKRISKPSFRRNTDIYSFHTSVSVRGRKRKKNQQEKDGAITLQRSSEPVKEEEESKTAILLKGKKIRIMEATQKALQSTLESLNSYTETKTSAPLEKPKDTADLQDSPNEGALLKKLVVKKIPKSNSSKSTTVSPLNTMSLSPKDRKLAIAINREVTESNVNKNATLNPLNTENLSPKVRKLIVTKREIVDSNINKSPKVSPLRAELSSSQGRGSAIVIKQKLVESNLSERGIVSPLNGLPTSPTNQKLITDIKGKFVESEFDQDKKDITSLENKNDDSLKSKPRARKRPRIIKRKPEIADNVPAPKESGGEHIEKKQTGSQGKIQKIKTRKMQVRLKKHEVGNIFAESKKKYPKETTNHQVRISGLPETAAEIAESSLQNKQIVSQKEEPDKLQMWQSGENVFLKTYSKAGAKIIQNQLKSSPQSENAENTTAKIQTGNVTSHAINIPPEAKLQNDHGAVMKNVQKNFSETMRPPKKLLKLFHLPSDDSTISKPTSIVKNPEKAPPLETTKAMFSTVSVPPLCEPQLKSPEVGLNVSVEEGKTQTASQAIKLGENVILRRIQKASDSRGIIFTCLPAHLVVETKLLTRDDYMRKNLSKSKISIPATGSDNKPPEPEIPKETINSVFEKIQQLIDEKISREIQKKLQQISEGFSTGKVTTENPKPKKINVDCDLATAQSIYNVLEEYFTEESNESDVKTVSAPDKESDRQDAILPDPEVTPQSPPATSASQVPPESSLSAPSNETVTPNIQQSRCANKRLFVTSSNFRQLNSFLYASGNKRRSHSFRNVGSKNRRNKSPEYFRFRKIRLPAKHAQIKEDSLDSRRNVAKDHTYSTSPPMSKVSTLTVPQVNSTEKSPSVPACTQENIIPPLTTIPAASSTITSTPQHSENILTWSKSSGNEPQLKAAPTVLQNSQNLNVQHFSISIPNHAKNSNNSEELIIPDNLDDYRESGEDGCTGTTQTDAAVIHNKSVILPDPNSSAATSRRESGHPDYQVVVTRTIKKVYVPTTGELTNPHEVVISDLILPDEPNISTTAPTKSSTTNTPKHGIFIIGDTALRNGGNDLSNPDPKYTEEYSLDTGYQFRCQICTVVLSSRPLIQDHVQRIHFKTSKNCYLCGVQLDQPHLLQHFLNNHSAASISR